MKGLLEELEEKARTMEIMCDSFLAIKLLKNLAMHRRTKHIDVSFHYSRELVNKDIIQLRLCRTKEHLEHIITKLLTLNVFELIRKEIGVQDVKQEA